MKKILNKLIKLVQEKESLSAEMKEATKKIDEKIKKLQADKASLTLVQKQQLNDVGAQLGDLKQEINEGWESEYPDQKTVELKDGFSVQRRTTKGVEILNTKAFIGQCIDAKMENLPFTIKPTKDATALIETGMFPEDVAKITESHVVAVKSPK